MKGYDALRADLREPDTIGKGLHKVFIRLASTRDGATAAAVMAAALDTPREQVADLMGIDPAEVDAHIAMFAARLARQIGEERARRSGDEAA